eukprot:UN11655
MWKDKFSNIVEIYTCKLGRKTVAKANQPSPLCQYVNDHAAHLDTSSNGDLVDFFNKCSGANDGRTEFHGVQFEMYVSLKRKHKQISSRESNSTNETKFHGDEIQQLSTSPKSFWFVIKYGSIIIIIVYR